MAIAKENLGLAAEFAVASELCRRNMYAQLTMGTHKRTDILIEGKSRMLSIQVKGKQVDSQNKPIWTGGTGDGREGLNVKPKMIAKYKEQWDKLVDALGSNAS
jgi:hypothetical protein